MSLLISVFLLTVITTLISALGTAPITNLLWTLTGGSPLSRHVSQLRHEILTLRKELAQTSSQDAFARWAKLRRTIDRKTAELEKLQMRLGAEKSGFERKVSVGRWVCTGGLRLALLAWFSKVPVFWVPAGMLPPYVEWGLAFPRVSSGAVSIQVWAWAVGVVVMGVVEIVKGAMTTVAGAKGVKVQEGEKVKTEL